MAFLALKFGDANKSSYLCSGKGRRRKYQTKKMRDIAIFGAGGFGREVACLIRIINESTPEPQWNMIGFFDDDLSLKGTMISHYGPCLGGMEELNGWERPLNLAIAIGKPALLKSVRDRIKNSNISFPNIVHPDFKIVDLKTFDIGKGNIIQGNCSTSCDVRIGDFNLLNGSVSLGHNIIIGNYNIIMPAVRVSGEVSIKDENLIGVGSIILQRIRIGNHVNLGAGAILMTKPKDGHTYIGNPAKIFKY